LTILFLKGESSVIAKQRKRVERGGQLEKNKQEDTSRRGKRKQHNVGEEIPIKVGALLKEEGRRKHLKEEY